MKSPKNTENKRNNKSYDSNIPKLNIEVDFSFFQFLKSELCLSFPNEICSKLDEVNKILLAYSTYTHSSTFA